MRNVFVLAACFFAAFPSQGASIADWRTDLHRMVNEIRALHPDPFSKTGELTFIREVAALEEALPVLSEEQRVVRAMRMVALLGDGHTSVEPRRPDFARWYPVRIQEFSDGFFVTSAHQSVAELAGARILEIAGRSVEVVASEARDLIGADNEFGRRERLYALHNAAMMKGLGYAHDDGGLPVEVQLPGGAIVDRVLVAHETSDPAFTKGDSSFEWHFRRETFGMPIESEDAWISAYRRLPSRAFRTADWKRPLHLAHAAAPFVARALPEQNAYYIQTTQIDDSAFIPALREALREIDVQKPRRLILDFRHNFGGDGSVVTMMVHEFVKRQDAPPWKELYVLIGPQTFSAAIMAVDALIDNVELTLVGEPAGAPLNSHGDATSRPLERTGLELEVSTLRHQLSGSDDIRALIHVDIPAPFAGTDYVEGRDPAVDPILRGDEMRSIPVIALADGGAAARRAFEDQKRRFSKYPWWEPPRELDLRRACDRLQELKRTADALATCQLNADIHPWVWNVWLNLAGPQALSGLTVERHRSLRRILEVDPHNFNKDVIEAALARGLRHRVFKFGATVADLERDLASLCAKSIHTRQIAPPFLPDVKTRQMQIDCDGFPFFGEPRRAELVFRDDSLEMIWIMTSAEEAETIRAGMTEVYGPGKESAGYVAFPQGRAALRNKPHEVLFYSERIASVVETWFGSR